LRAAAGMKSAGGSEKQIYVPVPLDLDWFFPYFYKLS
jgi:hypothetical protein